MSAKTPGAGAGAFGRFDHVRGHPQQDFRDDLLHGAINPQRQMMPALCWRRGSPAMSAASPDMMTKRARELGMTQSTFANSNGLPDPATR